MKLKDKMLFGLLAPFIPATIMGFMGYGWFYLGMWFIFYAAFGILGELWSVYVRKKTISQDISDTPMWLFLMIVASWIIFPAILIVHWWMGR